jgi:hypothetical protein
VTELEVVRKFRHEVPKAHRSSLDTRILWLWNQRFGTVQTVWQSSRDQLDKLAATMILQAILGKDLNNIALVFKRIEGGAQEDTVLADEELTI